MVQTTQINILDLGPSCSINGIPIWLGEDERHVQYRSDDVHDERARHDRFRLAPWLQWQRWLLRVVRRWLRRLQWWLQRLERVALGLWLLQLVPRRLRLVGLWLMSWLRHLWRDLSRQLVVPGLLRLWHAAVRSPAHGPTAGPGRQGKGRTDSEAQEEGRRNRYAPAVPDAGGRDGQAAG